MLLHRDQDKEPDSRQEFYCRERKSSFVSPERADHVKVIKIYSNVYMSKFAVAGHINIQIKLGEY